MLKRVVKPKNKNNKYIRCAPMCDTQMPKRYLHSHQTFRNMFCMMLSMEAWMCLHNSCIVCASGGMQTLSFTKPHMRSGDRHGHTRRCCLIHRRGGCSFRYLRTWSYQSGVAPSSWKIVGYTSFDLVVRQQFSSTFVECHFSPVFFKIRSVSDFNR